MRATKPTKPLPPERAYLVTDNTGLAHKAASDWVRMRGRIDLLEEATSAAMLALVRAAIGFKPELGWKFSTYAMTACKRTLWRLTEDLERGNLPEARRVYDYGDLAPPPIENNGPTERQLADLQECMAILTERETSVLSMRFYRAMDLKSIAEIMDLSKERVRQIQQRAVWKMQRYAGFENVPHTKKSKRLYHQAMQPVLFEDAA